MTSTRFLSCLAGAVVVLASVLFATDEDKKGVVTYADGQVKRKAAEAELWNDAPVNTDVLSGDQMRTYRQSRAELNLAELDIIRLAPRTTIDIVKLYEETRENKLKTQITLKEGELWAQVHEIEMNTEFDISAPVAAAAITGTILSLRVEADSTTQLKVYKGEVRLTNAPERKDLVPKTVGKPVQIQGPVQVAGPHQVSVEEWLYIVESMQQITLDKKGKVISKGGFKEGDRDEQRDWVAWNKLRDRRRLEQVKKLLRPQGK